MNLIHYNVTSRGGPSCRGVRVADARTTVHLSKTRTQQAQTASSGKVTNLLPWFLACERVKVLLEKMSLKKCAFTGTISMYTGNNFCCCLFFLAAFLPVKSLDTPSHLKFFLYFHDYLYWRFSLKASKL